MGCSILNTNEEFINKCIVDKNIYLIKWYHLRHEYYKSRNVTYITYEMPYEINGFTWLFTGVRVMDNLLFFYLSRLVMV